MKMSIGLMRLVVVCFKQSTTSLELPGKVVSATSSSATFGLAMGLLSIESCLTGGRADLRIDPDVLLESSPVSEVGEL